MSHTQDQQRRSSLWRMWRRYRDGVIHEHEIQAAVTVEMDRLTSERQALSEVRDAVHAHRPDLLVDLDDALGAISSAAQRGLYAAAIKRIRQAQELRSRARLLAQAVSEVRSTTPLALTLCSLASIDDANWCVTLAIPKGLLSAAEDVIGRTPAVAIRLAQETRRQVHTLTRRAAPSEMGTDRLCARLDRIAQYSAFEGGRLRVWIGGLRRLGDSGYVVLATSLTDDLERWLDSQRSRQGEEPDETLREALKRLFDKATDMAVD